MGFIAVARKDISLGVPLPWVVYDNDGNSLMDQGVVLETEEQLQTLLAQNPLRELSWNTEGTDSQPENDSLGVSNKELDTALADSSGTGFTFQDMRLRAGDRILLQPPPRLGEARYTVKLIGYLDNVDLLVTAPLDNGLRLPLEEDDEIIARIFSSQKAFGFSSIVKKVCHIPYNYLHLSFPEQIQGTVIRKSPRVRTNIIASITKTDAGDSNDRKSGFIVNLSGDGASIRTRQAIGDKGQMIRLAFRVNLHEIDTQLVVQAIIRSTSVDDGTSGDNNATLIHGIQFQNLAPNDSMILQSLIYQQMIEQPHSLT